MFLKPIDLAYIQKWCEDHDCNALVSYDIKPGENPKYIITITKESTAEVYSRVITKEEIERTPLGISRVISNILTKEAWKSFSLS